LDYGYNAYGGDLTSSRAHQLGLNLRKDAAVLAPADMAAMGDTAAISDGAPGPIVDLGPFPNEQGFGLTFAVGGQHSGRGNVLFCDAHIESERPARWNAPTDDARRRWNCDHEPHAELWPQ
jgi:prepilin-type processing-associated H-X9-DG protein